MWLVIEPRPGFNPAQVAWGAPDQERTDRCSYCDEPLPEGTALILWRSDGWCAEFCEACQATWWGMRQIPDDPDD